MEEIRVAFLLEFWLLRDAQPTPMQALYKNVGWTRLKQQITLQGLDLMQVFHEMIEENNISYLNHDYLILSKLSFI
jgi:hypothetical protein